jgi:hypothetical protein
LNEVNPVPERIVTVDLDDGTTIAVVAEQQGPQLVSDKDISAQLSSITRSIEQVSRETLAAVKKVAPTKGVIELGFGLAIEQGQLVALFGKGRAEATIKVTLEWSGAGAE